MNRAQKTPTIFILFGITGDLAKTKLLPSLFKLHSEGLLPEKFKIVGFARRPFVFEGFSSDFLAHCVYHQGNFDMTEDYHTLGQRLADIDREWGVCSEKIFHLAVSPFLYESVLRNLNASGLTISCVDSTGKTKLLIEKPIGLDSVSAESINTLLAEMFPEEHVYRIDHYLLKQSVQEQLPPKKGISRLGLTRLEVHQFETRDVDDRITFYDKVGAFRDVGQNHLLQLLALTVSSKDRADTLKTFSLRKNSVITPIRAQYKRYPLQSSTETAFCVSLQSSMLEWVNTELVLRSAKASYTNAIEIVGYKGDINVFRITIEKRPHEGYEKVYECALRGERKLFVSRDEVKESWRIADSVRAFLFLKPLCLYEKGTDGTIISC